MIPHLLISFANYPHTTITRWSVNGALREFTQWTNKLGGDIPECGSYVGVSAWFMANESKEQAEIYLFDSFKGLSDPSPDDRITVTNAHTWKKGDLTATLDELKQNLAGFKNIHIMEGWIPDCFKEVESCKFRLVHIDVDLYQPTLKSLEFFYPRLVNSGVIVLDDYGFDTCPGAYKPVNEFFTDKKDKIIHLPTGQGIVIRRDLVD